MRPNEKVSGNNYFKKDSTTTNARISTDQDISMVDFNNNYDFEFEKRELNGYFAIQLWISRTIIINFMNLIHIRIYK